MNRSGRKWAIALCAAGVLAITVSGLAFQTQEKIRVDLASAIIRNTYDWPEILGEVVNTSDFIIGRVMVTVTLKDATGKLVDTGYTYVKGKNVEISGSSDDAGIFPGERAPFSRSFTQAKFTDVKTIEYIVTYKVAAPRTDMDQTALHLRVAAVETLAGATQKTTTTLNTRIDSLAAAGKTAVTATTIKTLNTRIDSLATVSKTAVTPATIQAINARIDSLAAQQAPAASGLLGDLDNDRDVDFSDFLIFAQNFGRKT